MVAAVGVSSSRFEERCAMKTRTPSRLLPLAAAISRLRWSWAASLLIPGLAQAGPQGGTVAAGAAAIAASGTTTRIDQTTASAIVNWQSFSVAGDEFVVFNQPSASAAILNRVVGGAPSDIFGSL